VTPNDLQQFLEAKHELFRVTLGERIWCLPKYVKEREKCFYTVPIAKAREIWSALPFQAVGDENMAVSTYRQVSDEWVPL